MANGDLSGRLARVAVDVDLPRRQDLQTVFDELDYQMACQVYLWALPLVAFAQCTSIATCSAPPSPIWSRI
jgi:hypothetical protein